MRRALILAFSAVVLCGCGAAAVKIGMDEMQVVAKMGKPETVRKNIDGSQTWVYPNGPLGRQTYMVTVGADHSVKDVRQVLSDEYFSKVTRGMSRDDVMQILGRPGEIWTFGARDEEVWSWRYFQVNPMFFNVAFDRPSGTVKATQRLEEIMFLDQNM